MKDINTEIGIRLKKIRSIFNEGGELTGNQFAYLLGENGDKIRNYESGRSALPVKVLLELYYRGISPVYVISGEGSIFADNDAGRDFAEKIAGRRDEGSIKLIHFELNELNDSIEICQQKAAAGIIKLRKNEDK